MARRHIVQREFPEAHAALNRAQQRAFEVDAPWIEFEVKYRRALLVQAEGHASSADRLAREAHEHAVTSGWITRARRLRRDFPQVARLTATRSAIGDSATDTEHVDAGDPRSVQLQRHVDALVQVSQVSLSVTDSSQQARAILDEVVSLFGAERAFLFLLGEDDEEPTLFAARDALRGNLRETYGYSTTVVERVLATRQPVVVAGSENAVALGSESAVLLNLRSIISAPLLLRDRLVGVVYLDHRLASGIFTELDAQTLTAISSHIAIAIEASRTAQLEHEYKTERDKRKLAEALRAMTSQSAALSHDSQIVARLLDSVFRFVPATRADCYVLRGEEWKWVASKVEGFDTRLLESG
ncbi:MAG: GAF domain-containing protein, partial [Myxococcota bacterium]